MGGFLGSALPLLAPPGATASPRQVSIDAGLGARPIVAVERSGRKVVVELGAAGGELRLKADEDLVGQKFEAFD